jgi:hypothetical protein
VADDRDPPSTRAALRVAAIGVVLHAIFAGAVAYVLAVRAPARQVELDAHVLELSDTAITLFDVSSWVTDRPRAWAVGALVVVAVDAWGLFELARRRATAPVAWFLVGVIAFGLFAALGAILFILAFPFHNLNDALVR